MLPRISHNPLSTIPSDLASLRGTNSQGRSMETRTNKSLKSRKSKSRSKKRKIGGIPESEEDSSIGATNIVLPNAKRLK
jgi:hypothetical protein